MFWVTILRTRCWAFIPISVRPRNDFESIKGFNVAFFSRCDLLLQTNCHYYHDHDHYYTYHRRGKKYYYAPEYFIEPPPPSLAAFKIDMWAMGIVLFLLSSGESWSFVLSMRGWCLCSCFAFICLWTLQVGSHTQQNLLIGGRKWWTSTRG